VTAQTNLDLVRSIVMPWERGDFFSSPEWADPEIEFVLADGPDPGSWTRLAAMSAATLERISAWEGYRFEVEELRGLDHDRVLVLTRRSGRGRTSGLEVGQFQTTRGAWVFRVRSGRVARLVGYFDRERALADLGLASQTDADGPPG
jgi:ketosteroid isomerase-like protein